MMGNRDGVEETAERLRKAAENLRADAALAIDNGTAHRDAVQQAVAGRTPLVACRVWHGDVLVADGRPGGPHVNICHVRACVDQQLDQRAAAVARGEAERRAAAVVGKARVATQAPRVRSARLCTARE